MASTGLQSDNSLKGVYFSFGKISRAQWPWVSEVLRQGAIETCKNHQSYFLSWFSYLKVFFFLRFNSSDVFMMLGGISQVPYIDHIVTELSFHESCNPC